MNKNMGRFYFPATRKPDFKKMRVFDYNEYWKHRGLWIREDVRDREKIFIDWVKEGSNVLDIACGNAPVLKELKEKKNCRVVGIDISSLIVEEQKKIGVPAVAANITDESFCLETHYDYIVMSEILEHIQYPEKILEKIKNSAEYFIISVPNSAFYRYRTDFLIKGRFFTQWACHPSEHVRYWSHIDFLDWLEAIELEVVDCKSAAGLSFGKLRIDEKWKNLFAHQICYLCHKQIK